jgi:hypothetical protein
MIVANQYPGCRTDRQSQMVTDLLLATRGRKSGELSASSDIGRQWYVAAYRSVGSPASRTRHQGVMLKNQGLSGQEHADMSFPRGSTVLAERYVV